MKLDNTIAAVVTGGASGLGEGTARAIAATGAKVALFDLNAERGEEIAREIGGVAVSLFELSASLYVMRNVRRECQSRRLPLAKSLSNVLRKSWGMAA